eukprot:jgi/Hompol1/2184/HPOL_002858-RA
MSAAAATTTPAPSLSLPLPSLSGHAPAQAADASALDQRSFNQGYYDRFFVQVKKLGRGQRGSVFLCRHMLDNVSLGTFAVKQIPVGTSHSWLVRILKEVNLLESLRHANVIEYLHAWLENRQLTTFGPAVPCLFILMNFANGGNLEDYLCIPEEPAVTLASLRSKRVRKKIPHVDDGLAALQGGIGLASDGRQVRYLTADVIRTLFKGICKGLVHLHRHGIIHRDLKPQNLLLRFSDESRSGIPHILISDFGECEVLSDTMERQRTGATGTLEFMPPELLQKDRNGRYLSNHSQSADLWSLGVVLYFLCYATVPYSQVDDVDILKEEIIGFENIVFPPSGSRVPTDIKDLICRLMVKRPELRPTAEDILQEMIAQSDRTKSSIPARRISISDVTDIHEPTRSSSISEVASETLLNADLQHDSQEINPMRFGTQFEAVEPFEMTSQRHVTTVLFSYAYRLLQQTPMMTAGAWITLKIFAFSNLCAPGSIQMHWLNTIVVSALVDLYLIEK